MFIERVILVKKIALVVLFALAVSILAACGGSTESNNTNNTGNSGSSSNTITMDATAFSMDTITIAKGSTITFTNAQNSGTQHILVIGNQGIPATEDGAPDFGGSNGHTVDPGQSFTTGAWDTAGTFHITCLLHPTTMNLIVTVTG